MASDASATSFDNKAKRVVLRLKVSDFEGRQFSEYVDAIKAYLLFAKRPTHEYDAKKHYAHIEPFQSPELRQTSFHIIIDIEKDMLNNGGFQSLPHEIYRIRRSEQGDLEVKPFKNPVEAANFLSKMRRFTDTYSWAK
ncbi:hypothetical protein BKA61DRAFT_517633 [Leptodontidium sp. MPI-SDFR-AT-0119]|nr:hypothetical protein BKA61DRAFT_517633 [Leptodontidium sp. MPI-SDFR-AT-0119]